MQRAEALRLQLRIALRALQELHPKFEVCTDWGYHSELAGDLRSVELRFLA